MRDLASLTDAELTEAHYAAEVLLSERFRPYLPGHALPVLLAKWRDDLRDVLGMALGPRRLLLAAPVTLGELTSAELDAIASATSTLLDRFTDAMDDPELCELLAEFGQLLTAEKAERAAIQRSIGARAGR